MTLKEWFRVFHSRPLKIAAAVLLIVWIMFAVNSYLSVTDKQAQVVSQTADLLSLTGQSHDLVMTETLLETLLSEGGASSAALCEDGKQVVGANQDFNGCRKAPNFFERRLSRKIPGSSKIILEAKFNFLTSFASILSFLGFGLLLVIAGFYFIHAAQKRIQDDILQPVLEKLLSSEDFEINELNELRDRLRASRDAEEQRAVTIAIQENNIQVAHDIRGPINSISNLLKRVKGIDDDLCAALNKAIARANNTADALLSNEKVVLREIRNNTYDFAELIRDIVIEKRPIFIGGSLQTRFSDAVLATCSLSRDALGRVLSNLIDNAILACRESKEIELALIAENGSILMTVTDSGCGMPPEILVRLGEKGFTSGDEKRGEGHGLGVYSAIQTIEGAGGSLRFESAAGHGTVAAIRLPARVMPSEFPGDLILIDNDSLNVLSWELAAQDAGLKCASFGSMDEFLRAAHLIPPCTPIFVDSDLGQGEKGEEHAPMLKQEGFQRIFISTSYTHLKGKKLDAVDAIIGKNFDEAKSLLRSAGS